MMKAAIILLVSSLCLAQTQNGAPKTDTPQPPKTMTPSDVEQLGIVRLRAQILEATMRVEQAQKEANDLQTKLVAAVKAAQDKLPAASTGKAWQPQDDRQFGVLFIEVPVETKKSEAKPEEKAKP